MSPARSRAARREYLRRLASVGFAVAAVVLIEVLSRTPLRLLTPAAILLTAVVGATVVAGMVEGLIAAALTTWYFAYFVSAPGTLLPYSHETLRQVLIFACSAPAVALMVGLLRQRAARMAEEAARRGREAAEVVAASLASSREAEQASRAAEERYRNLFEGVVAGVMRTFRDGRIVDCNQACLSILGYDSREELMAQNAGRFFRDPGELEALMERLAAGEVVTHLKVAFQRKNGRPIWVLMNARRMREGSSLLYETSIVDVTTLRDPQD